MKKIFGMFFVLFLLCQISVGRDFVTHDVSQLPVKARELVKKNFPKINISYLKIDDEIFRSKNYEVTLTDGTEIEFDKNGEWKEIDCKKNEVPAVFVSDPITQYVSQYYPDQHIVKIEKLRRGYQIELSNDLDITFDVKGHFLRMDD